MKKKASKIKNQKKKKVNVKCFLNLDLRKIPRLRYLMSTPTLIKNYKIENLKFKSFLSTYKNEFLNL